MFSDYITQIQTSLDKITLIASFASRRSRLEKIASQLGVDGWMPDDLIDAVLENNADDDECLKFLERG